MVVHNENRVNRYPYRCRSGGLLGARAGDLPTIVELGSQASGRCLAEPRLTSNPHRLFGQVHSPRFQP